MESLEPPQSETSQQFYFETLKRVSRFIVLLFLVGLTPIVYWWGLAGSVGYFVGAVLAYVNFLWLRHGVEAIGSRITQQGSREQGGSAIVKAFLRYALVGAGGYAIFESSEKGFYAFLAGLFLPVFAMLCEAAYELYGALRRAS
jgi:hypothetical protein